jgi:hypothetical protein
LLSLGKLLSSQKEKLMVKPEKAKEILSKVCGEFIPGKFIVGFDVHEKQNIVFVSTNKGNAYGWAYEDPELTEKLLFLDAHSFCAWVIRIEGDDPQVTSKRSNFRKYIALYTKKKTNKYSITS